MDIRPIRTEADYREALSKVDSLWTSATPDTPEGDQLDILVTLIQVYEREHYPIPPPDPIVGGLKSNAPGTTTQQEAGRSSEDEDTLSSLGVDVTA